MTKTEIQVEIIKCLNMDKKFKIVYKSAITGKFITRINYLANPRTSYKMLIKLK